MSSNRPYLIRALHEWLLDNDLTPHLMVDATRDGVIVPQQFVDEGRIVLNISPTAVRDLQLGNELISFSARFGGSPMNVRIPPAAVLGIYSRENSQGMLFMEPEENEQAGDGDNSDPQPPRDRPTLKVIK
ncbi:MAG: ClpXP protease specificity-enhancing factor [Gammaproteobacteria bacterium]|nr:ClpXP protease specificity-enhancing factor [Gammaproteobacteria bacterium]